MIYSISFCLFAASLERVIRHLIETDQVSINLLLFLWVCYCIMLQYVGVLILLLMVGLIGHAQMHVWYRFISLLFTKIAFSLVCSLRQMLLVLCECVSTLRCGELQLDPYPPFRWPHLSFDERLMMSCIHLVLFLLLRSYIPHWPGLPVLVPSSFSPYPTRPHTISSDPAGEAVHRVRRQIPHQAAPAQERGRHGENRSLFCCWILLLSISTALEKKCIFVTPCVRGWLNCSFDFLSSHRWRTTKWRRNYQTR